MSSSSKGKTGNHSDSDDTLTSSDLSDLSDYEGDKEDDDFCDSESCLSLAFSVKSNRSTVAVKSAKTKKKVRFKPGDSLVLVYEIPNREMLGLRSASESSDSEYSASDSEEDEDGDDDNVVTDKNDNDEESDENEDDLEDEEDDDDDDDEEDESDEDDDDDECKKSGAALRNQKPKLKPVGRLVSVKHISVRKPIEFPKALQKPRETVKKLISLDPPTVKEKKKTRKGNKLRDKKDKVKVKTDNVKATDTPRKERNRKNKSGAITADLDSGKVKRPRRNKTRLLEIKATVESNHKTNVSVPKLVFKHDFKPTVVDVNGSSLSGTKGKQLISRSKLQPTSIRLSKRTDILDSANNKSVSSNNGDKPRRPAKVVSASYDSLSSIIPKTYVPLHEAIHNQTVEESLHRLDPNDMNATNKRLYAWQIANGNITSQSLRTPSILPFLESLKTSVIENGAVDVPS